MSAKDRATLGLVTVAVGCALVSTALSVRRELFSAAGVGASAPAAEIRIDDWAQYTRGGHRRGPVAAPVTIVEFADFECPACQQFARNALPAALQKYGQQVSHIFRHWPLPQHRFAYPAARAAVCASRQGKFTEFHDAIYAAPDSLGFIAFSELALRAGVADTTAFNLCNSQQGTVPEIESDIIAAKNVGANGTPTILVNGLLIRGAPDSLSLFKVIDEALEAKRK